jgi:hypothetical protein
VSEIIVVFFGSPLRIYIFSNMGYLLSCALALGGYFFLAQFHPELARPVRMPSFMKWVALAMFLRTIVHVAQVRHAEFVVMDDQGGSQLRRWLEGDAARYIGRRLGPDATVEVVPASAPT